MVGSLEGEWPPLNIGGQLGRSGAEVIVVMSYVWCIPE
jgi:hypothetical protein